MKMYQVPESDLLYLIECRARLEALEAGGVDNWSWYGESYISYLSNMKEQYKLDQEEDLEFIDIAEREIQHYREVISHA